MTHRSFYKCLVLIVSICLGSTPASGEPAPGSEIFQVNTYTTYYQYDPKVATDGAGAFVVVWASGFTPLAGPDGAYSGVQARRYDSSGCAQGDEFTVNTNTFAGEFPSSVEMHDSGSFVVAWQRIPFPQYPGQYPGSARLQRFDSSGGLLGEEVILEPEAGEPKLGMDGQGRYVAVWPVSGSLLAQLFDADGTALGDQIELSLNTNDLAGFEVAMADDGEFLVVWGQRVGGGVCKIVGQRFDQSGLPLGATFDVNSTTIGCSEQPSADYLEGDGFVVVWERGPGGGRQLLGQIFDAMGSQAGEEFQINTYNTDRQQSPRVAADPRTGGFAVVWTRQDHPFDDTMRLLGRRFDSVGQALASEFRASAAGQEYDLILGQDIAIGHDGDMIIVWNSKTSEPGHNEIFARRILRQIFADGFESGGLGAWSDVIPGS